MSGVDQPLVIAQAGYHVGHMRSWRPAEEQGDDVPHDHAEEDRDAAEETAEQHAEEDHGDEGDGCRHRLLLEVVPRDRGEVEPDQRDDRAGDDRRHELVDPAHACELHDEAHRREKDADGDDAREGGAHALRRGGRSHRRDERERRAEVAGELVAGDDEEEESSDEEAEEDATEDGEEADAEEGDSETEEEPEEEAKPAPKKKK